MEETRSIRCISSNLDSGEDTSVSPVKANCWDQREAVPGEPRCVICGRYGQYICDVTNDDVCSLECKEAVLCKHQSQCRLQAPIVTDIRIPIEDECTYVRDGQPGLPEWEPADGIKKLSNQQVESLRREIDVHVKGEGAPPPILDFSNCKFVPRLKENLESAGYSIPTPVQMQTIPAALKGRNILVSADTGSGKTAAFLIPIVSRCSMIRMQQLSERTKPLAMVLTPTRELCAQVEEQAKALGKGLPFKTALIVGGDAMPRQVYRIKQGIELIIGTPGRLIDLLSKHDIELGDVCMLVLDEVDCVLQQGFRDEVMQIIKALSYPQIMMFSATIPCDIEKLSSSILKNPLLISAGKPSFPNGAVKQTVIWVESKTKKQKLFDILKSSHHFRPPSVVFVNSRVGADLLSDAIKCMTELKVASIHGEKSMQERRQILKSFLVGELSVVVATGVLGRGLDLLRVNQVIVFDMPHSLQEYIHQVGRASRLGMPGSAIVFINNEDKALFNDFISLLKSSGAPVPRELANSPYWQSSYAMVYKQRNQKKRKHHL
eukprot:Gb_22571 [translate_table: standard]